MRLCVIIPAGGASTRFNEALRHADPNAPIHAERSKLDEDLGGRPVLQRTVELFSARPEVAAIIVAGPHDDRAYSAFLERHGDKLGLLGCRLCRGGATHRYETVQAALKVAETIEGLTHIAVHDAARPCTPIEVIDRVVAASERHGAVIPAVAVGDTLKRASDRPVAAPPADPLDAVLGLGTGAPAVASVRLVGATVDRAGLFGVQTPQVFEAGLLRRAYAQSDLSSTDDAQLIERLGHDVVMVEGDVRNIKITRPGDIALARAILGVRAPEPKAAARRF